MIGEDELARGVVQLKALRDAAAAQVEAPLAGAVVEIGGWLARDAGR